MVVLDLGVNVVKVGVLEGLLVLGSEFLELLVELGVSVFVVFFGLALFFEGVVELGELAGFFFLTGEEFVNDSLKLFDLVIYLINKSVLNLISMLLSIQFLIQIGLFLQPLLQELLSQSYNSLRHLRQEYGDVLLLNLNRILFNPLKNLSQLLLLTLHIIKHRVQVLRSEPCSLILNRILLTHDDLDLLVHLLLLLKVCLFLIPHCFKVSKPVLRDLVVSSLSGGELISSLK